MTSQTNFDTHVSDIEAHAEWDKSPEAIAIHARQTEGQRKRIAHLRRMQAAGELTENHLATLTGGPALVLVTDEMIASELHFFPELQDAGANQSRGQRK